MTQQEYVARIAKLKKNHHRIAAEINVEYEGEMRDIRRRKAEAAADALILMESRTRQLRKAREDYKAQRQAIEDEYMAEIAEQRKAGHICYNDFLEAVKLIRKFLRQADKESITIPWGTNGSVDICFKENPERPIG